MNKLTQDEVRRQSENAYNQWKDKWHVHAKLNGELYRERGRTINDLRLNGLGRTALVCAFGPSFEENIDLIIKYGKDRAIRGFDILCVDKAFSELVKHGVIPDYVIAADAQINYEDYLEPYLEASKECTLICTMTSNPKWYRHWKGKSYIYVNKDNIQTEAIFGKLSGCNEFIPASSNVGNAVIVFACFVLGYEKYCLIGYDFCWGDDESYYAFKEGGDKRYWMNHAYSIDSAGRCVNTSNNLIFSARWLADFINNTTLAARHGQYQTNAGFLANKVSVVDCSGKGVLYLPYESLEANLSLSKKRKLTDQEKIGIRLARAKQKLITHNNPQDMNILNSKGLLSVVVNYVDDNTLTEIEAM